MSEFKHISVAQTAEHVANGSATICDIRDPASFNQRHIEGAFHLTNQSMVELLQTLDYDRPIIVVCYHGHSSQSAAQYLCHQGFEEVYSMDGGFEQWALSQPYVSATR